MKKLVLFFGLSLLASSAFAREPKATACAPQALRAATGLFLVNNPDVTSVSTELELIDMDHSEENGYEVWDVKFSSDGQQFSPYRMTLLIDACTVSSFNMPFAG